MDAFDLGATIGFKATFLDEFGAALVPAGATLRIFYLIDGVETIESVAMVMNGGEATYSWDSSVPLPDPGLVYWDAVSTGSVKSKQKGVFALTANPATLGYVG